MKANPYLLVTVVSAILAGVSCVGVDASRLSHVEREEERFAVEGTPTVDLFTADGSIEVRPWERPEVQVIIEKHTVDKRAASAFEVRVDHNASHVSVEVNERAVDRILGIGPGYASLVVSAPANSNVHATSGDGSISIEGLLGAVELSTRDGSIRASRLSGGVSAHTGDGAIRLEDVDGSVRAETGDGSIFVGGRLSRLRVRSGDGGVTIRAVRGSTTEEDWELNTGDGPVTVELPDDFAADLDARTGDGRIEVTDLTASNLTGNGRRDRLKLQLGAGGHSLRIYTGDGGITLRRYRQ